MPQIPRTPLPPTVRVELWPDTVVEATGHPVSSAYVETFWLPLIGPTSLWVARRLAAMAAARPTVEVDVERLAVAVGVSTGRGPNDVLPLTFRRLRGFDVIDGGDGFYRVRTHLPALPTYRVDRLPDFLRTMHDRRVAATQ